MSNCNHYAKVPLSRERLTFTEYLLESWSFSIQNLLLVLIGGESPVFISIPNISKPKSDGGWLLLEISKKQLQTVNTGSDRCIYSGWVLLIYYLIVDCIGYITRTPTRNRVTLTVNMIQIFSASIHKITIVEL